MNPHTFGVLLAIVIGAGPVNSSRALAAERPPPNVLFILTDDQGWGDAGFAGHPYAKTPP